jgi:hypothetical protein
MWARLSATGVPAPPSRFPLMVELYETGLVAVRYAWLAGKTRTSFTFEDISFPVATTNLGRFKVLDPETRAVLMQGSIGALW